MKTFTLKLSLCLTLFGQSVFADQAKTTYSGYDLYNQTLTKEEARGRDLWYKATGGNKRHHSYVLQQRFNAPLDFYRIFGTQTRGKRFATYGLINDPDCKPGNESSYGFDICPGDEDLLKYVGKEGYRDPACDVDQDSTKEDSCLLEFGTSTGSIGFRKFPNPRFKKEKWVGWENWDIHDASVEPPFLFGTTCASCHVGFDPANPPTNKEDPQWNNIRGAIGNVFLDNTAIFTSGMPEDDIFWQTLSHVRPGTTDTSAVPHDAIHNTGTFNAIINFDKRPTFKHKVSRWRRDAQTGKWQYGTQVDDVMHILKGGEDSVGVDLAMLRVYVNIGMCSEECWQNNLMHLTQFSGRGLGQRPFDIAQCRRDCSNWRAMEDRIDDMASFLISRRPTDLKDAKSPKGESIGQAHLNEVVKTFDSQYAAEGGVFEAGRKVFAKNCASCHSSLKPVLPGQPRDEAFFLTQDFLKTDAKGVRIDWLGNDERTPAAKVGTTRCRSLHNNHGKGQIWEQFSSETFKSWAQPGGIPELEGENAEGRGYYRNISLLSVWAHAPFMHNNGVGPEQCSPHNKQEWECVDADPSIAARIARYEESMKALLYPETRAEKISRTNKDIGLSLQMPVTGSKIPLPIQLNIPKGTPVGLLGSLDIKAFANHHLNTLKDSLADKNPVEAMAIATKHLQGLLDNQETLFAALSEFSNCTDLVENKGHTFGAELSDREKTALIQYMKNF